MSVTGAPGARAVALAGGRQAERWALRQGPFRAFAYYRRGREERGMPQLPRGPAASVGEDRRGGSVKVRRRTQGKREAGEREGGGSGLGTGLGFRVAMGVRPPVACAVGAIRNSAFFDDEEGAKRR